MKRGVLCAAALLCCGASDAAEPVPVRPARQIASPDYPPRALRNASQGRTAFAVHVGADGRIQSCEITSTSGDALLDDETCRFARRGFQFDPVTDEQGDPAPGIFESVIVWRLPRDEEPAGPNLVNFSYEYVVEPDGTISGCRQVSRVGEPPGFTPCEAPEWTSPLQTRVGRKVATRVIVTRTVTVQPVDAPEAPEDAIDYRASVE